MKKIFSAIALAMIMLFGNVQIISYATEQESLQRIQKIPSVKWFRYEDSSSEAGISTTSQNRKAKISFYIWDESKVFVSGKGKLIKNGEVIKEVVLNKGQNSFSFDVLMETDYQFKIFASYKKDNKVVKDEELYYHTINIKRPKTDALIELKDIEAVSLYKTDENGNVVEVEEVDVTNFNVSDYIAKVSMADMQSFYSKIKSFSVEDSKFILTLDYNNAVSYLNNTKENQIKVVCGQVESNIAKISRIGSFDDIINIIKNNPNANIVLTKDLDLSNVNVSTATMIANEFSGTFDGNGYSIKNAKKPLFSKLSNATVKNLVIENATMTSQNAILANNINNSTINNVHIKNSSITLSTNAKYVGMIAKDNIGNTTVENCSISGSKIIAGQFSGGMFGVVNGEVTIKNSYVDMSIESTKTSIGGMVGQSNGILNVENSYVNTKLKASAINFSAGLIGNTNTANTAKVNLKNVISLSDGTNGFRISGNSNRNFVNTYEISQSNLRTNSSYGALSISKDNIDENFFKTTLSWDTNIWDLEGKSGTNLPRLKNLDLKEISTSQNTSTDLYIPEISRLKSLYYYDSNREIAYSNMYKLMPFYDANLYVDYANDLALNSVLNTKKIDYIIPYDKNGKMISSLNTDNYNSISNIKIIFEDKTYEIYNTTSSKKIGDVATYKIPDLFVEYNYHNFILNTQNSVVNEIINYAKDLDYTNDIASLTPETESRLYVDYYNQSVKTNLDEVIKNILASQYNVYLESDIFKTKVKNELIDSGMLKKLLYTFNYYDKWYNIDIGGLNVSDILFFNVKNMINENYDINKLAENTLATSQSNRATNLTQNYYNALINPQTNKTLKQLLEYFMKLEGYSNGDDWLVENFKGLIMERGVQGKENEVDYRAWTLINKRGNNLLPILSAPQEDMYIISVPSQVLIGSLNKYSAHVNSNETAMKNAMSAYADKISNFYSVSSTFIDNSTNRLNLKVHFQYDTRFNFPKTGSHAKGTTEDPVIKWVYEAIGAFSSVSAVEAYANGTDVYWVFGGALNSGNYTFKVFSHETAHNQDGYYFYEGRGRRSGTWAEDHADANIAQDLGDGSLVFNISQVLDSNSTASNNLTFDRINSKEKIHSYYNKVFETYYVLDYLTAQALLKLTPTQQEKLISKVSYPDSTDQDAGGVNTVYNSLTSSQISEMNLTDMESLWDNKIVLTNMASSSGGYPGRYGGDSHYNIYWYQPHNDNGRPDSYSFKRLGFEMLGVGGYTNGYVAYRSNASRNDLEALRTATGNPTITWKEYKLQRYQYVEENLKNISYFDVETVIEEYKNALIKDAEASNKNKPNTNNVRRKYFLMVKRATNDFESRGIYDN